MTALTFITAAPRSGTSLLVRLLGEHPDFIPLSQPVPLLLVELKRRYLVGLNRPDLLATYPLADQQYGTYTPPADFSRFLMSNRPSANDWGRWLDSMSEYSGQYTRPNTPRAGIEALIGRTALDALLSYIAWAGEGYAAIAWKEVFAEEYIPALLSAGHGVILLLRDPRDCIASQLALGGRAYSGQPRPLLYLCRQWRKTALYALAHAEEENFLAIRYEDLAQRPAQTLDHCFPGVAGVRQQRGWNLQVTAGNSSFGDFPSVSASSIGTHEKHLAAEECALIEALCGAEMNAFGYKRSSSREACKTALMSGCPSGTIARSELSRYGLDARCRDEEMARLTALADPNRAFLKEAFIFRNAYEQLVGEENGQ